MSDVAASCRGLVRLYPADGSVVQALRGVDLTATRGTVTAIVGPSGSGKSTLLGILAGLDRPTAGEVTIAGRSLTSASERRRRDIRRDHIGYVFQRPTDNLVPRIPIEMQLTNAAHHRGAATERVEILVNRLGLEQRAQLPPERLSGGEQQRAAIARAAIGNVDLLICDEPTAELDSATTLDVCNLLQNLAIDNDTAVIVATHDPLVVNTAHHVLLIRDGAVQSETFGGDDLAVIDSTGRLQLPPELAAWYPANRARLTLNPETHEVRITPP